MRTNVAVDRVFDFGVIGPEDATDAVCNGFDEKPEAQESDPKIPILTREARQ